MLIDFSVSLETETYRLTECAHFRKTNEEWGEFSNMCRGFPILVRTSTFQTITSHSEALYQAMRFPELMADDHSHFFQEKILKTTNPMKAKMITKPFRKEHCRLDWLNIRIEVMWWTLRMKLMCNPSKFGDILLSSSPAEIVEVSRKDSFWGAKPLKEDPDIVVGQNILGKLLMQLRENLQKSSYQNFLFAVSPPKISHFTLCGSPIITTYYQEGLETYLEKYGSNHFWKR